MDTIRKVRTSYAAAAIRRTALKHVADHAGISVDVLNGCIAAGHKRYAAKVEKICWEAIELLFAQQTAGKIEIVTA